MSDNHPAPPAPFPTRAFVAIGIVWVLIDLPMFRFAIENSSPDPRLRGYLFIWQSLFAARVVLFLGWWIMGEGTARQRFAGILLFSPILGVFLLSSSEPLAGLVCVFLSAILVIPYCSFPYLVYDGKLTRDAPRVLENKTQLSLRQLMLLTFLIAMLLGLLRWIRETESLNVFFWLSGFVFSWMYPLLALLGFLRARLYPSAWYAVGATIFFIAVPFSLKHHAFFEAERLTVYLLFIAGHILLLRYLGFRLIKNADIPFQFPRIIDPNEKPSDSNESATSPNGSS